MWTTSINRGLDTIYYWQDCDPTHKALNGITLNCSQATLPSQFMDQWSTFGVFSRRAWQFTHVQLVQCSVQEVNLSACGPWGPAFEPWFWQRIFCVHWGWYLVRLALPRKHVKTPPLVSQPTGEVCCLETLPSWNTTNIQSFYTAWCNICHCLVLANMTAHSHGASLVFSTYGYMLTKKSSCNLETLTVGADQ